MSDFYRERDRLAGGTDSQWVEAANFEMWHVALDNVETNDQRGDDNTRFSGVLSQADLAE